MLKMNKYICFIFVIALVFLGSCKSGKILVDGRGTADKSGIVAKMFNDVKDVEDISYRMKISATVGGKRISANSTLKIKKNNSGVLSVTMPLLGIELGRIEFDNEKVVVIDRFHKMFVELPAAYLSEISQTEMNMSIIRSLFLNNIFVLGTDRDVISKRMYRMFDETVVDNRNLLLSQKSDRVKVDFEVNPLECKLLRTTVGLVDKGKMEWVYSNFSDIEGVSYPQRIKMNITVSNHALSLQMDILKISFENFSLSKVDVSEYRKVTLEQCLKMLGDI